jgi:hypothetical protein
MYAPLGTGRAQTCQETARLRQPANLKKERAMPKYVIEREIPGAGKLSADELKAISQKSCGVLRQMGPQIQWVESFVTNDKRYMLTCKPGFERHIGIEETKSGRTKKSRRVHENRDSALPCCMRPPS